MSKRLFIYILALLVFSSLFIGNATVLASNPFVSVVLSGKEIPLTASARIVDGRTLVPLRGVFEAMGATVKFTPPSSIDISIGDKACFVELNSSEMKVGDEVKTLDVPARLIGDYTFVPLRAITEALGAAVRWVDEAKTVIITKSGEEEVQDPEIIMYTKDGEETSVPLSKVSEYKESGWFLEKQVKLYSVDGRENIVSESEVEANQKVGWYSSKPVIMYSYKGESQYVSKDDVAANQKVGWFLYDDFIDETNNVLADSLNSPNPYPGYKYLEAIEKNFKEKGLDEDKIEDMRIDYIKRWSKKIDATIAIVEYDVVTNYEGRKQANVTLMNLSSRPISAFELKFSCRDIYGNLTTDSDNHDGTITGWSKKANIAGYSKRSFGWVLANNSQTAYISDFVLQNVY